MNDFNLQCYRIVSTFLIAMKAQAADARICALITHPEVRDEVGGAWVVAEL